MNRCRSLVAAALAFSLAAAPAVAGGPKEGAVRTAQEAARKLAGPAPTPGPLAAWVPAVEPKPLSKSVRRGLEFLARTQLPDGSWGQGEESAHMGSSGHLAKQPNVADTCVAALALLRAGSNPSQGEHAEPLRKAAGYVLGEIEASDADSLWVTSVRNTRVQGKLGPHIDTFMASLFLAEVKDRMPSPAENERVARGLAKVLHKIERNQRDDGGFDGAGWAPVLSQAVAGKGVNRAAQAGAKVPDQVRTRLEGYAKKQWRAGDDSFADEGSAGVGLYAAAATVGAMRESVNTNEMEVQKVREQAATGGEADRKAAEAKLGGFADAKATHAQAEASLVKRLKDPSFVAGFGSNGGEEFLSYMLVSESLVVQGGEEWAQWDAGMTANLERIQNADGSWTGHHCITGRTFVTASALLVLTADRAPVPVAARVRERG